ncbi:hypothetical protein C8R42DRAFT_55039 [Lentinula raphanica]|nr:hypothetical protein C8R42DRAFT_55039 [Lentinula raphanica]
MQHNSKLSKTRSWVSPTTLSGSDQLSHPNKTRVDNKRTSVPLVGRKPGFFAQLFSSKASSNNEPPVASSFVNLSRKPPSAVGPDSKPPNLAIRSLSPDLLNDPAFSTNPLSHPLFVTNPDYSVDPSQSKLISNRNSQADVTQASPYNTTTNNSLSLSDTNSHSPPSESSSLEGMGTSMSSASHSSAALEPMNEAPSPASSYTDITTSSTSSKGLSGKSSKKNLIVLEPPRILSPPPAYNELSPTASKPPTVRNISVPTLPSSQTKPAADLPPRPATTANDTRIGESRRNDTTPNPTRRNRGLDPIDELDESNPLGLALHHESPYEAIKKVTQSPREPQNTQQRSNVTTQKTGSGPTNGPVAVPSVPFGASLNLSPGQILPRNFHPYTQPLLQKPNYPNTYPQRNDLDVPPQQVLRPVFAMQKQQPQRVPFQHVMQPPPPSSYAQSFQTPPTIRVPQSSIAPLPTQQPETRAAVSLPAAVEPTRHPSPALNIPRPVEEDGSSVYGDEVNAYDGIEDEGTPTPVNDFPPETVQQIETTPSTRAEPADVPQIPIRNPAAVGGDDDPVARALRTVALERARIQKNQEVHHENPPVPLAGFSAFGDTPLISDRRDQYSGFTPPLPPGAAPYKLPSDRYEQQGRPSESQTAYNPYVPTDASNNQRYGPVNQPDIAWHRRAASHNASFNTYNVQPPQRHPTAPSRPMVPRSNPHDIGQLYGRPVPNPNVDDFVQRPIVDPLSQSQQRPYPHPDPRDIERPIRSQQPAPSIQQSVSSTASRNGLPPRHVPSRLTMPQPLYNPNAPPTRNGTPPSHKPQHSFQPPQHGTGSAKPMPVNHTYVAMRGSPAPDSYGVQAQIIPMADDSRKVLRKRGSVQADGLETPSSVTPGIAFNGQAWHSPSSNHPPTRSKSEMRPPAPGNRMPPSTLPPDRKAPRRLLSKKRAEF